jgi:hypothetical protein
MIDVLVYLFETSAHMDSYPEPNQLASKLTAAGFEQDEIEEAMGWLSGLESAGGADKPLIAEESRSIRLYSAAEHSRLDMQVRGAGAQTLRRQTCPAEQSVSASQSTQTPSRVEHTCPGQVREVVQAGACTQRSPRQTEPPMHWAVSTHCTQR